MAVTGPAGMGRKLGALRRFTAAGCRSVAVPVDRHTRRRHAVGIRCDLMASPCNRGWVSTVFTDLRQRRATSMGVVVAFVAGGDCLSGERLA